MGDTTIEPQLIFSNMAYGDLPPLPLDNNARNKRRQNTPNIVPGVDGGGANFDLPSMSDGDSVVYDLPNLPPHLAGSIAGHEAEGSLAHSENTERPPVVVATELTTEQGVQNASIQPKVKRFKRFCGSQRCVVVSMASIMVVCFVMSCVSLGLAFTVYRATQLRMAPESEYFFEEGDNLADALAMEIEGLKISFGQVQQELNGFAVDLVALTNHLAELSPGNENLTKQLSSKHLDEVKESVDSVWAELSLISSSYADLNTTLENDMAFAYEKMQYLQSLIVFTSLESNRQYFELSSRESSVTENLREMIHSIGLRVNSTAFGFNRDVNLTLAKISSQVNSTSASVNILKRDIRTLKAVNPYGRCRYERGYCTIRATGETPHLSSCTTDALMRNVANYFTISARCEYELLSNRYVGSTTLQATPSSGLLACSCNAVRLSPEGAHLSLLGTYTGSCYIKIRRCPTSLGVA